MVQPSRNRHFLAKIATQFNDRNCAIFFSVVGVVFGAQSDRFPDDTRRRFAELFRHYQAGKLKPRIWKTFALEDAASALAEMTARRVVGKMVLTV